ncbi:putative transcriptional regulator, GntR family [Alkaliphilus metalliredigens QYMF]|uniref:Putative transcriptional regulator, GntR family n=1 Tax=Alkaliphilus metalliredigens (strain QYMF) TaxID=293826 RepID=A6TJA6_ALKMQ|nr:PLP-dependent aminotransferase family protein [Alkaliphilus metalliredigens]ABR46274.1 putative transcriptional regulator, GntR family [Alkaliphilus metalliredigens QYMF]
MKFARRMEALKASEIREILKLIENPDVISFAGGLPAPELFPVEEMKKVSVAVLEEDGQQALQYSATEGYRPLREKIAKRMEVIGIGTTADNILITSGSQQGLDFSGKVFLDEDDVVVCESPSYLGAINAFRAYSPKFVEIETDEDGMIIEDLEKALAETKNIKMIYVIPDFQNPSGRTWSIERRKRLIALANQYDLPVVEDNPYGELRFEGERPPAIKSFDTEGRVIYLGTFSKTFCPGLRLGWTLGDGELLQKYIFVKQGADLHTNTLTQRELNKFLEMYDIDAHIEKIKDVYRKRRDVMMDSIKKYFPKNVKYTYPEGGLFTWCELPQEMNAREIFLKSIKVNVAFVPGGSFFPNGGKENTFRLNYSMMSEEKIEEGIKRLGKVLQEEMTAGKTI